MQEDPEVQALATRNFIEKWILADPDKRSVKSYFEHLSPGMILSYVRKGELKPWPLFAYEPISDVWLGEHVESSDTFYMIDDIVNNMYWVDKVDAEPESCEIVTQIMDELWEFQT